MSGRTAWECYVGKLAWWWCDDGELASWLCGKLAWWWLCGKLVLEWYDDGNWESSTYGKLVPDGGLASELRCGGSQCAGSWRSEACDLNGDDDEARPPLHSIHHHRRCISVARRTGRRRTRRRSLHRRYRSRGLWERDIHLNQVLC